MRQPFRSHDGSDGFGFVLCSVSNQYLWSKHKYVQCEGLEFNTYEGFGTEALEKAVRPAPCDVIMPPWWMFLSAAM